MNVFRELLGDDKGRLSIKRFVGTSLAGVLAYIAIYAAHSEREIHLPPYLVESIAFLATGALLGTAAEKIFRKRYNEQKSENTATEWNG